MTVKHIDHVPEEREALAPYNFVPLPERIVAAEPLPDQDRYHPSDGEKPRYTGRIHCLLKTCSPLYVRCGVTPKAFAEGVETKSQTDFFNLGDINEPIIPGSSLRGLLRTLVEIVGYGKIDQVMGRSLVYRAVGERQAKRAGERSLGDFYRERLMREDPPSSNRYTPLMRAGYIVHQGGRWAIRPAQNIGGTTFGRIEIDAIPDSLLSSGAARNASRIWFAPGIYADQPVRGGFLHMKFAPVTKPNAKAAPGLIEGSLARSGSMKGKRWEAVFYPPDLRADLISIDQWMVTAYREQVSKEQRTLLGDNGVLVDGQPVFYLIEQDKLVFFGHTMMFRIPYLHSPRDFVPNELREFTDEAVAPDQVAHDLAEAIFGYGSSERNDPAYAGRVFVENGCWTREHSDPERRESPWLNKTSFAPRILSGPKPTTFQHYLTQSSSSQGGLHHYAKDPGNDTVIRGHKLYWHQGSPDLDTLKDHAFAQLSPKAQASDTQHTHFNPVAAGVAFTFDIHFENLSQVELGALLWVLGKANDPAYRLALGMGKPFGMGAVSITPTVYESCRADRYTTLFRESAWADAERSFAESVLSECISTFNDYVIKHSKEPYERLEQTLRIQCLLLLLAWDGPLVQKTRYMEIERDTKHSDGSVRGKERQDRRNNRTLVNEYSYRPVLPHPQQVYSKAVRTLGFRMPERTALADPGGSDSSRSHSSGQRGNRRQQAPHQPQGIAQEQRDISPPPLPPSVPNPELAALNELLAEIERMRPGDVSNMMRSKVDRLLKQEGPEELRRRVAEAIVTKAKSAFSEMKKVEAQKWYSLIAPLLAEPPTSG